MLARAARTVALAIVATIVTGCLTQAPQAADPSATAGAASPAVSSAPDGGVTPPPSPTPAATQPVTPGSGAGPPFPAREPDVALYDLADIFSGATEAAAARRIGDIGRRQGAEIVVFTQVKPGSDAVSTEADARVLAVQWRVSGGLVMLWNIGADGCAAGREGNGTVQLYAGSRYSARHLSRAERQAVVEEDVVPLVRDCNYDDALLAALDGVAAGGGTAPVATPSARPTASGEGACGDDSYELSGYRWEVTYNWHLADGSIPDEYEADRVLEIVEQSASNITSARNDCGLPDNVDASARYAGTTTAEPCESETADGFNTVGFGQLPAGTDRDTIAFVCPYGERRNVAEADILINSDVAWALSADDCGRGKELLEATLTHEFGHVFGLDHVSERENGDLTMSPVSNGSCAAGEISLGLGDIRGLEDLY